VILWLYFRGKPSSDASANTEKWYSTSSSVLVRLKVLGVLHAAFLQLRPVIDV
jgi:hypothetical protein